MVNGHWLRTPNAVSRPFGCAEWLMDDIVNSLFIVLARSLRSGFATIKPLAAD
jgi:hypothetical protein